MRHACDSCRPGLSIATNSPHSNQEDSLPGIIDHSTLSLSLTREVAERMIKQSTITAKRVSSTELLVCLEDH